MAVTVVSLPSVSPRVTMWVVFVAFARRNAFGAVFASLGMSVPVRR